MFSRVASSSKSALKSTIQKRFLNLQEYQSKSILRKYGVNIQTGEVVDTPSAAADYAAKILKEHPNAELVIKSQVLAGGRGKGHFKSGFKGGIQFAKTPEAAADYASKMLHQWLVTHQTTADGELVEKLLVSPSINISKETYFAILMDRKYNGPVIIASKEGGVEIEKVAETNPDAIITMPIDISVGLTDAQAAEIAEKLGFTGPLAEDAKKNFKALYDLFIGTDATQVEINPLSVGSYAGYNQPETVMAIDAKLNFDDNAAYRQKEIFAMRNIHAEDPRDVAAEAAGLNYVGLDGNIGCMVNGAGLAMATMDIIKLYGGNPANFLDVGGSATTEQVKTAFEILTSDKNIKAILVNIFGGIMKCDTIAQGIINAAKDMDLKIPVIVRLEGTNVELGKQLIRDSGLNVIAAADLDDAAKKAAAIVK